LEPTPNAVIYFSEPRSDRILENYLMAMMFAVADGEDYRDYTVRMNQYVTIVYLFVFDTDNDLHKAYSKILYQ